MKCEFDFRFRISRAGGTSAVSVAPGHVVDLFPPLILYT